MVTRREGSSGMVWQRKSRQAEWRLREPLMRAAPVGLPLVRRCQPVLPRDIDAMRKKKQQRSDMRAKHYGG